MSLGAIRYYNFYEVNNLLYWAVQKLIRERDPSALPWDQFLFQFFHFICIVFWHMMRHLSTPFHNQNKISLPYIMASILLHKFKLNIKRCFLNQSDPNLCPNNGNISLPYGVSFVGYLQRDTCELPETP